MNNAPQPPRSSFSSIITALPLAQVTASIVITSVILSFTLGKYVHKYTAEIEEIEMKINRTNVKLDSNYFNKKEIELMQGSCDRMISSLDTRLTRMESNYFK